MVALSSINAEIWQLPITPRLRSLKTVALSSCCLFDAKYRRI